MAVIWTYRTILEMFDAGQRRRFWRIVALSMAVGVLDLAGVAMILPFLAVLADPQIIHDTPVLAAAHAALGFETTGGFLGLLGIFLVPFLFVYGYLVRVLRVVIAGETETAPMFEDWGELFADGLSAFVIGAV